MKTFIAVPEGQGPFTAVVMYQNVGGLSDYMRDMARRVAQSGYYCAIPDVYYRLGNIVIDADSKDKDILAIRAILTASNRDASRVMADTMSLLAHIDRDPVVRPGPKGCIGFCGGGRFAPLAAGTFPEVFKATTALFGTRLVGDTPDSPHLVIDRFQGELYFGFAENDIYMPLEKVEKWRQLLQEKCKSKWTLEIHSAAQHGYAFPGRPVYNRPAAEASWARTFEMFHRQLPR